MKIIGSNFTFVNFLVGLTSVALALHPARCLAASGDAIADAVIGQPNFTSSVIGGGAAGMEDPQSVAVDPRNGRIYVSSYNQNRILSWPSASAFFNGQAADKVIGQANFTDTSLNRGNFPAANNRLAGPLGLAVDYSGNLYVADFLNNRVLEFDDPSQDSGDIIAERVFGQPDFVTRLSGTTTAKLDGPRMVALDLRGRLVVSDTYNRRVVGYNAPLTTDGIGDKLWTTNMNDPYGVAFDLQGNLYVSQRTFNRVFEFDLGFEGDDTADRVFGQTSFNLAVQGVGDANLNGPRGICVDFNGNLYVTDSGNNRIVIFNSPLLVTPPGVITEPAGGLIGQLNFTANSPSTTSSTFNTPSGCDFNPSGSLFVADTANGRALRFDGYVVDPAPATRFTSKRPISILDLATAQPNPSQVVVSDIFGQVSRVIVTLKHVSHTFPGDLDIYLQGPQGQKVALMSDVGGGSGILHANLTLDSLAANSLQNTAIASGTFKPTNVGNDEGPNFPSSISLSDFNGVDPNGTWSLFVSDDGNGDIGAIGSWGLNIYTQVSLFNFIAPTPLKVGEEGNFSVIAFFEDGDNATIDWDFGDGGIGSGNNPSHTFNAPGTYLVTVTVTSTFGGTDSASKNVVVIAAPTPTFTTTATATNTSTATVTITPSVTATATVGGPNVTPIATPSSTPGVVPQSSIDLRPVSVSTKKVNFKRQCNFIVQNFGSVDAPTSTAQVFFSPNKKTPGKSIKKFSVPALTAGQKSKKFSAAKAPGKAKYCRVVVDPDSLIREIEESNNAVYKKL